MSNSAFSDFLQTDAKAVLQGWVGEAVTLVVLLAATALALRAVRIAVPWICRMLDLPRMAAKPLLLTGRGVVVLISLSILANRFLGLQLLPILGGMIALIGIGFVAVWSTLSNMLCTALILAARPYRIGDVLEFAPDPWKGRVLDLNLLFTTLETEDGRLLQVPNNFVFQRLVVRTPGPHSLEDVQRLQEGGSALNQAAGAKRSD